ncbi:hypothetical protein ACJMK2_043827 [Sinanodonta woodiana]|uniref:Uncharacterized protein n=1 Tax=Sinanodonta woodiana TaxID=1069815 RepID=A0ABD3VY48_SINWO
MRGFITIAIVVFLVRAKSSLVTTFEEEIENEIDLIGESDVETKENDEVATEDTHSTFDLLQNIAGIEDQSLQDFKDVEGCSNSSCTMCFGLLCFKLIYKQNTNTFQVVVGIANVQITLIGFFPAAPFGCCELSSRFKTCILADNIRNNQSDICANVTLAANLVPFNFPYVCIKK